MVRDIYLLINPFALHNYVILNPLRCCKNTRGN